MSVKVKFLGGVRTVTGSCHFLGDGDTGLLVDCGLYQGRRDEAFERNASFSFDPAGIDALVLSHAHIDHSGNIPTLVKKGFTGRILTTDATRDLCMAMLPDSGHIQEEDIKFVNKIHARKGLPPRKPLYTGKDADKSLEFFAGHPYRQKLAIGDDVSVTFYDAGHVLGSATPLIEFANGGAPVRIGYAVDLGRKNIPILNDPETPPGMDYLFLESTYGGRLHGEIDKARKTFIDTINATVERGGTIVIPSFALERTQEIAYNLKAGIEAGAIPEIPVYVDSPLAVNVTEVFIRHPECYDKEMYERFRAGEDPLGANMFHYITDVEKSKELNDDPRSKIIISASGMCEAGRILHHLKNNIGDPRNTVLIVGFMAENTLGRRIAERHETVRIFGEEYPLRAEVRVIDAFSAHADQRDLLEYVEPLRGTLKRIFVVHGEEEQSETLAALLAERGFDVHVPVPDEELEID
ncbi:MAG: MBL fold metallo-hydrolase [Candidatus Krumholzibacteriota bacterium]|nr:MBL fold metallo-hydrolase [Candidatus Krumholzibacteriota bacterium]